MRRSADAGVVGGVRRRASEVVGRRRARVRRGRREVEVVAGGGERRLRLVGGSPLGRGRRGPRRGERAEAGLAVGRHGGDVKYRLGGRRLARAGLGINRL
jgi:hypothetical protein